MAEFTYTARDPQGAVQNGRMEALDEDQVVSILQRRGLLVTAITRRSLEQATAAHAPIIRGVRRRHRRVTVDDQVLLCQQLATLLGAGVPLLRSLHVVTAQVESQRLHEALDAVRRDVEGGESFHAALGKHPQIFSTLWLNLVETGEASGHLAESLQQLARHFESIRHLRNQALTAVTYPAFLVVAMIGVMALFVYWMIPKFTGFFATMDVELPLLTQFMIVVSELARRYVLVTIAVVAGAGITLQRYLRSEPGRWMRDRLLLRLPAFKALVMHIQLAEFARGLATLLESGVPLLSTLRILETSATNKCYGQAIGEVREIVKEGRSMAEPMSRNPLFLPMAVQMVQVGEEVGELGPMAGRIAVHYEACVETFIARMTRLFEPVAIVAMAGMVLVVVLSIFMPIFKMAGEAGITR